MTVRHPETRRRFARLLAALLAVGVSALAAPAPSKTAAKTAVRPTLSRAKAPARSLSSPAVSYPGAAARAFLQAIAGGAGYRLTQGYGDHRGHAAETGGDDPYGYGANGHDGWDIALGKVGKDGSRGAPIHAPAAGRIFFGEERGAGGAFVGLGRWVRLAQQNGASVTFGHLGAFGSGTGGAYQSGQKVAGGAVLGYEGDSGNSTGYHVHVTTRDAAGRVADPNTLLRGEAVIAATARASQAGPAQHALQDAEARARRARADHEANRELYKVGGLARVALERSANAAARAEADLQRALTASVNGGPATTSTPASKVEEGKLESAKRAYDLGLKLYALGVISRVELQRRAREFGRARAR